MNIKDETKEILSELGKIKKQIDSIKKIVKVGLPSDSNDYPDGTSVILVGFVHEFGSTENNVPERSFLRSTIFENEKIYLKDLQFQAKLIVNGKNVDDSLNLIGLKVSQDVQTKITDIKEPPLKYREGNPLILTGHLRRSITYQVKSNDN